MSSGIAPARLRTHLGCLALSVMRVKESVLVVEKLGPRSNRQSHQKSLQPSQAKNSVRSFVVNALNPSWIASVTKVSNPWPVQKRKRNKLLAQSG